MKNTNTDRHGSALILALVIAIFFSVHVFAENKVSASKVGGALASVIEIRGNAWIIRNNNSTRYSLKSGDNIHSDDLVITGSNGEIALLLADESLIRLHHNSEFQLQSAAQVAGWLTKTHQALKSSYQLLQGELWFRNKRRESDIKISTEHVSISVRGTEFGVIAKPDATYVNMLEGSVSAGNPLGSVEARDGEQVVAERGKAPYKRYLLNPDDAVQWTIRLPKIFSTDELFPISERSPTLAQAIQYLNTSEFDLALATVDDTIQSNKDSSRDELKLLKAWIQFRSNDIKAGYQTSKNIVSSNPNNGRAWQLLALTALINNKPNESLIASNSAIARMPNNAENWLLKSYSLQALFRLSEAREAAKQATQLSPLSTLSWIQLSALNLARGDPDNAERFAQNALTSSASDTWNRSDALSQLGFVALAKGHTRKASEYFSASLSEDSGFAPAHLGSAITAMRSNNASDALKSIAKAATLEPLNANYLNYFAKILYELNRPDRAIEVLERSAKIDANDPTPLYLQAIIERDKNHDHRAIQLLHQAAALNDNRGVYRSKQLLDTDRAVKGVDLTIAFDPFDFTAWSEYRAIRAIESDENNYSAHLMFANALNQNTSSNLAFASENLKARLLAPVGANPFVSTNDYTSLFEHDDHGGVIEIGGGSFDSRFTRIAYHTTNMENAFTSLINASVEYNDGHTNTFDEKSKTAGIILKWDPSYQRGITLSARSINLSGRDNLKLRSSYDAPSSPLSLIDTEENSIQIGYRDHLTPNTLLMSQTGLFYHNLRYRDISTTTRFAGTAFEQTFESEHDRIENGENWQAQFVISHVNEWGSLNLGSINFAGSNNVSTYNSTALISGPPLSSNPSIDDAVSVTRKQFHNVFAGVTLNPFERFRFESAIYYEYFQNAEPLFDDNWDITEPNLRLGITYTDKNGTTLRAAGYQYIHAALPERLDKVQHAGIVLFNDNIEGTVVDEVQLVMEHEYSGGFLSISAFYAEDEREGRRRFVQTDSTQTPPLQIVTGRPTLTDTIRSGANLKLNFFLSDYIGARIDYRYLRIQGDELRTAFIGTSVQSVFPLAANREDQLVTASISIASPAGLMLRATHRYRKINFSELALLADKSLHATDVRFEWELPRKNGLLQVNFNNVFNNKFNNFTDQYTPDGITPRRNVELKLEINLN